MSVLKSPKRELIGSGSVMLLLGVLMCAWPVETAGVMCAAAGIMLALGGAWRAAGYFWKKEGGLNSRMDFAAAALLATVGLMMAFRTEAFLSVVPFILGVMILAEGVFQVQTALELRKIGYERWKYYPAAALIGCAAAVIMMFDPFGNYRAVAVTMGAAFIADGAMDLWTALYLKEQLKKLGLT